jgi:Domain of unknown function (DUF1772)
MRGFWSRRIRVKTMETVQEVAKFLTTLCCGLFAGAAIYVNLVEHPARMQCGTDLAATEFGPSYRRATVMQASLAATGFVCSIATWLSGGGIWWLIGGILLGSVIPFTVLIIMRVNKQLLDPTLDKGSAKAQELLSRWGKLHAVRSSLSGIALVIFLLSG